ncbi:sirohydrochlorin chelatase [Gordonia alkaliphila]|uniref:sirohydrochlorin chelatase n=1 Tax=Gordonia alkaliphila TaxID=1053547 RepID=UPI001FF6FA81|nr:sirohydrochlorin chelatase [Gordonia alkaliphila]MCK0437958.1 sirohydrochlorin chelatase [Gordonia alkaliphila]
MSSAAQVVLAAHGSRDPRFAATARRVAAATRRALPDAHVDLAYLDLNEPLLDDVLAELRGAVTVVPLLFGDGFHSKVDLPALLARAVEQSPRLRPAATPVLGRYSPVPALIDRLAEAGLRAGDGVLMYAVGSSDPGSDASIVERGRELSAVLGVQVETVFATRLGTEGAVVRAAVDALTARGAQRIAASPLFLSAGLLTERVERQLDEIAPGSLVAGPLADHPALISAITRLVQSSVEGRGVGRLSDFSGWASSRM